MSARIILREVLTAVCTVWLFCGLGACGQESRTKGLPAGIDANSELSKRPDLIARGEYLAKAGDCSACHDAADHTPLAGGQPVNSPLGPIYASNITPDPTYGIGRYSLRDFSEALRFGKAPHGKRLYPAMPYPSFANLTDDDLVALYAYLMHGVKPSAKPTPATRLPFPFNQRWGMAAWSFMFGNEKEYAPEPERTAQWNRGAYLVQGLGHCGACHSPRGPAYNELGYNQKSPAYLTGGVNDHWLAPNLTGDLGGGLGRWSLDDVVSFLTTGHGAGAVAFGAMVPVVEESTQYLTDDDVKAIAVYLKSLPAHGRSGTYVDNAQARIETKEVIDKAELEHHGAGIYLSFCAHCHEVDGQGQPGKVPALAGNQLVLASDPTSVLRIVIEGSRSPQTQAGPPAKKMPGFHDQLTTQEIADVMNFVRSTWGNHATPLSERQVARLRSEIHQ